jgi:hypothetical protein
MRQQPGLLERIDCRPLNLTMLVQRPAGNVSEMPCKLGIGSRARITNLQRGFQLPSSQASPRPVRQCISHNRHNGGEHTTGGSCERHQPARQIRASNSWHQDRRADQPPMRGFNDEHWVARPADEDVRPV